MSTVVPIKGGTKGERIHQGASEVIPRCNRIIDADGNPANTHEFRTSRGQTFSQRSMTLPITVRTLCAHTVTSPATLI